MKLTSKMLLLAVPLSVLVLIFVCRHMGYCLINIQDVDNNNTYVEGMIGGTNVSQGGCSSCGCGM